MNYSLITQSILSVIFQQLIPRKSGATSLNFTMYSSWALIQLLKSDAIRSDVNRLQLKILLIRHSWSGWFLL